MVGGGRVAALSSDGRHLVTVARDGQARTWEVGTGRDGRWATVARGDAHRLIRCELCDGRDSLLALARARLSRELSAAERREWIPAA